ncbi:hypothetical protein LWI29_011349 [Acer saccharum]|uniref:Uncharacterized protein n=1 Tax=Acer saccharum TaxID=4024 RepID=A0AA39SPS0_ACESA|nr:hypothetical protein LWI29_011349 [Acer saccharum]
MKPSEVIGRLLAYESRKARTSSSPKKQKGIALKTSQVEKEDDDSDEDEAQMVTRFKKFFRLQRNDSKKNKKNEKEITTSSSDSESVEDSSSDEELANYYTAFGASHVDVGEEGKNASICDLEEGIDEKVARGVIDVATQREVVCMTSNDQGKGLDEGVDSISEGQIDECCSYSCEDDNPTWRVLTESSQGVFNI